MSYLQEMLTSSTNPVAPVPERLVEEILHQLVDYYRLPSGKHTKNYGKSQFLMGNLTINCHFQ